MLSTIKVVQNIMLLSGFININSILFVPGHSLFRQNIFAKTLFS